MLICSRFQRNYVCSHGKAGGQTIVHKSDFGQKPKMLPAAYSREDFGNFSFSLGGRLVLLLARHCHVQGLWLKVLLTAKSQDLLQNSQILRLARYMQMESSCCFYSLTEKSVQFCGCRARGQNVLL